ncbi:hypothetical protein DM01DRAFT_307983 [Hesseltinella vesiculosa]|uniref:Uncharacterized protein n=1 Tax=Hesseltinella vesiculosa TaxID=101127 RepID=A0A1X2G7L0_9FUNG|nr:hypothetical protein DM01DRAFT_307983 [Hesseltinella vesiculosa]
MLSCLTYGGCELLDDFAIGVQLFLGSMVILALVIKRQVEHPRRPFTIWYLDVSKQCICAGIVHLVNVQCSYLARSWYVHEQRMPSNGTDNVCVWYLASVFWDTTLGLGLLYAWLKILTTILIHGFHLPVPRDYGDPPFFWHQLSRWGQQTIVFLLAALAMKLCQLWSFLWFPWFLDLGRWLLSWASQDDDQRSQIIFVMLM